ncbi:hypothetical protein JW964_18660 [candidate division KSB1 bacterium]|nr:hypothetical protein [candidate division KSB1 bacterium]
MPYRTPINTDAGRISFMERCTMQNENEAATKNPLVETETMGVMKQALLDFKTAITQRGKEAADQIPAVAQKEESKATCGMWISHFFQVLSLWIKRELHDEGIYKYYSMDVKGPAVPPLYQDNEVLYWGEQLLQGEAKRIADGGPAMMNPSAEQFKPIYETYKGKLQILQKEKNELNAAEEAVNSLRARVDQVIDDAIAELEFRLRKFDAPNRRRKMRTYGVNFSYRPEEIPDEEVPIVNPPVAG